MVTSHTHLQEIDPTVMDGDEIPNDELGQNECQSVNIYYVL